MKAKEQPRQVAPLVNSSITVIDENNVLVTFQVMLPSVSTAKEVFDGINEIFGDLNIGNTKKKPKNKPRKLGF